MNTTPLKSAAVAASMLGLCSALVGQSATVNPPASSQQYKQQANRPSANPAADSTAASTPAVGDRLQSAREQASPDPRGRNASQLIGLHVTDRNGESLGKINDLVIDTHSGKVVYGVVSSGGILGVGDQLRAIPFAALRQDMSSGQEQMRVDIDQARWGQAPAFTKEQVASLSNDLRGQEISRFYGQPPAEIPQRKTGSGSPGFQPLVLASELMGREIRSGEQTVGKVEDVIVQPQSGTAAALLDPSDDFAGTDQKYLVPFSKLLGTGEKTVNTSLSRKDFSSAKMTSDDSWARSSGGNALFVWPSVASLQQQAGQRLSSAESGGQSGRAPVEAIQQAIQADPSSARSPGLISIAASGDRVILSGTVQSEEVKERIGDRALQASQGWNVENQLRVAEVSE